MPPAGPISDAIMARRRSKGGDRLLGRAAFTLVELLVTMVIIAILAALTLAGLAGVRQNAKADKTRNTIRKIDAVIRPMYDSYRNRRVIGLPAAADRRTGATQVLREKRRLMAYEMPDRWEDVPSIADVSKMASGPTAVPPSCRTSAVRGYAVARPASPDTSFGGAECLYMILERSGYEPDALEFFRFDEIGDVDKDGRREFLDGWGRPIEFLRWAPGFVTDPSSVTVSPRRYSTIQVADKDNAHDPLDPTGIDPNAYALVPLIYSGGPDGALGTPSDYTTGYGLQQMTAAGVDGMAWLSSSRNLLDLCGTANEVNGKPVGAPLFNDTSYLDNITNHDLTKK